MNDMGTVMSGFAQTWDAAMKALERMADHDPRDPGLSWTDNLLLIQSAAQAAKDVLAALSPPPHPPAGLSESLYQSCLSELTEGHLALDRLGSPREVQEGDIIRECLIAERIATIPHPPAGNAAVEAQARFYDGELANATGQLFDALNEIKRLRAAVPAAVREALEECARIADAYAFNDDAIFDQAANDIALSSTGITAIQDRALARSTLAKTIAKDIRAIQASSPQPSDAAVREALETFQVTLCDDGDWIVHTEGDIIAHAGQGNSEQKARAIAAALQAREAESGTDPYKLGKEWCPVCKHDDGTHEPTCKFATDGGAS